jgi:ATP-dependent DNA helicase DinG
VPTSTPPRPPGGDHRSDDSCDDASGVVEVLRRVAGHLPAGERRPQQEAMAQAVQEAITAGRHLVVQAGTGTGKSLAYLVPAVLSGKKVVVATATKALQDQLAEKDLPLLAEAAGRPFRFAVLKGRSNYLCRQRADEVASGGFQPTLEPATGGSAETGGADGGGGAHRAEGADAGNDPGSSAGRLAGQLRRLLEWSEETATGDRAELPFEPHPRAWAMVSVGPRECPGAYRCPAGGRCFAEGARAAAAAADVVVVNTHLYGAHLASGGAVLPPHEVVIFDEAHELEAVMTESLGVDVSPGRLRGLGMLARPLLGGSTSEQLAEGLADAGRQLEAALEGRTGQRVLARRVAGGSRPPTGWGDEPAGRQRPGIGHRRQGDPNPGPPPVAPGSAELDPRDQNLATTLENCSARLERVMAELRRHAGEVGTAEEAENGPRSPAAAGRHLRALSIASHLAEDLQRLAARTADEVAWVGGSRHAPVLRLSPIDVAPALTATLWCQVTAVLTSATIPLRTPERLGLDGFALDQLDVGSPFDYRSHALLYVARHLPDRRQPTAEAALHEELEALIGAAGGRTLALFTSRQATETAAQALSERLPYRVLVQGELPKGRLLAHFATDETSCLFATLGFWQGVDVPGPALTLVTLDRLPFARPDDPLLEARRERAGDDAFRLVDLPRAAMLLAQGAGRLIRSADDRGVVAVLDPRLATAGYRAALLAALPPMRRSTDRRQVTDFLARVLRQ